MRTQVAIVGAGPAGLLLAHLLHLSGIESIVIESRSREYVESRIRAGVLEQGTVDLLNQVGLGDRLGKVGLVHRGIQLSFEGQLHRIDLHELTGGRAITVYGQTEVVKDLIQARLDAGAPLFFEVRDVSLHAIETNSPRVRFQSGEELEEIECDFIAGCDGFHGVCRPSIPTDAVRTFERSYPFAWLGVLAQSKPPSEELIYCHHSRGFALFSMRTPSVTRLYIQCEPNEVIENWPDERIWQELQLRLGAGALSIEKGTILQKGITPMRSFVSEPMQYRRLFLAGDAAHIVPPTGAKGMNLAVADVRVLGKALANFYEEGSTEQLDAYSTACLKRVWRAEHFSNWMTSLLHRSPHESDFHSKLRLAELEYLTRSRAAATALAENYVGLKY